MLPHRHCRSKMAEKNSCSANGSFLSNTLPVSFGEPVVYVRLWVFCNVIESHLAGPSLLSASGLDQVLVTIHSLLT